MLFAAIAEAQAPLCNSVLMKDHLKISQTDIDQTIASIARMKMELDLAKAEGSYGNSVNSMLHQEYSVKLAELKQHLRDRMSEPELHRKITERISFLQGKNKEIESRQRAEVKELVKPYELVRDMELTDFNGYIIGGMPSQNLILTRDGPSGNLYLIDLATQNRIPLPGARGSTAISSDGKTLLSIDPTTREVKIWEMNPLREVTRTEILGYLNPSGVILSPSSKTVLIYTKIKAYLLDMKTGVAKHIFSGADFNSSGDPIKFISENEIVFVDGTQNISIFDIASGKETSFPSKFDLKKVWASPDGKRILWESKNVNNNRTIGLIDRVDLKNINQASRILPSPVFLARFHPTKDLLYVYSPQERGLYQQSTLEQVESFPIDFSGGRNDNYHLEPLYDTNSDRIYLPKSGGVNSIRSITLEVWERN
jgi:hypothetical protein